VKCSVTICKRHARLNACLWVIVLMQPPLALWVTPALWPALFAKLVKLIQELQRHCDNNIVQLLYKTSADLRQDAHGI